MVILLTLRPGGGPVETTPNGGSKTVDPCRGFWMPCTSITCSLTCNTSGARWHYGSGTESSIGSYARKVCGLQHRREDKSFFAIITTAIAQMILAGRDVGELLRPYGVTAC